MPKCWYKGSCKFVLSWSGQILLFCHVIDIQQVLHHVPRHSQSHSFFTPFWHPIFPFISSPVYFPHDFSFERSSLKMILKINNFRDYFFIICLLRGIHFKLLSHINCHRMLMTKILWELNICWNQNIRSYLFFSPRCVFGVSSNCRVRHKQVRLAPKGHSFTYWSCTLWVTPGLGLSGKLLWNNNYVLFKIGYFLILNRCHPWRKHAPFRPCDLLEKRQV